MSRVDSSTKLRSTSFPDMSESGILFPNLKTVQPVLPFYRSLVTPAELANTPGTLPSLPLLSSSVPLKPTTAPEPCAADHVPKKKSRKSSMPIKIEKEAVERDGGMDEGSGSEDETTLQVRDREESENRRGGGGGGYMCTRQSGEEKEREERGVYVSGEREREGAIRALDRSLDRERCGRERGGGGEEEERGPRQFEAGVITCASSPYDNKLRESHHSLSHSREHTAESRSVCQEPADSEEREEGERVRECVNSLHTADKLCDAEREDGEPRLTNGGPGGVFGISETDEEGGEARTDDYGDSGLSHRDPESDLPHHCEICSKTFKNPYSVKMHYRNIHLKEMHMCTVGGCNAAFPSRRSRDR